MNIFPKQRSISISLFIHSALAVFFLSLSLAETGFKKTSSSHSQSLRSPSLETSTTNPASIARTLPLSLKTIKELGKLVLERKIPRLTFESAALHHVIEQFLNQASSEEKQAMIHFLRPYGRLSPESLSIWHLASFFKDYEENRIFQAWRHGTTLLESPLLPLFSPPDMELFLHTLNNLAHKNSLELPQDFHLDISLWPLPSRETLLLSSRCFYLLRKGDENLAKSWNIRLKKDPLQKGVKDIDLWGFQENSSKTDHETPLETEKVKPSNPLALPPESTFYYSLVGSFLFLSSSPPGASDVPKKELQSRIRSRKRRVRLERNGNFPKTATDLENISIQHAKRALHLALSDFHSYLACLQLAYLYKKRGDASSEAKYILKSLDHHPTTGAHLRLAQFYRDQGNWKLMHLHNSKAQEIDPHVEIIKGPQPLVSR